MQKDSQGDIIADTLQFYRDRTKSEDTQVPKPYLAIKKKLQQAVSEGKRVLIDVKDSYSVQTVVVHFEFVSDRWAKGSSICYVENKEVKVPYTVHYSDIYCKLMNIKLIVEGEDPFEEHREGTGNNIER